MANTVVIYTSKCGSTEQYAKWIAEELNADLFNAKRSVPEEIFFKYQNIIFGMPIYSGNIFGGDIIKNNFSLLKDKNVYLFVVGMTKLESYSRKAALISTLPGSIRAKLRIFQMRGNYNFRKLSIKGRLSAYSLHNHLQYKLKKNVITDDELELLYCLRENQKWLDKNSISQLINEYECHMPLNDVPEDSNDGLFILNKKGELYK